MAIRFEDKGGAKPGKKDVGGKTYVAEEPAAEPKADTEGELPFGKPARSDKKPGKTKR